MPASVPNLGRTGLADLAFDLTDFWVKLRAAGRLVWPPSQPGAIHLLPVAGLIGAGSEAKSQ